MKKKILAMLAGAMSVCAMAGLLSACSDKPTDDTYAPGGTLVDQKGVEYTLDANGEVTEKKYTGTEITVRYLVDDASYVLLSGEKVSEMALVGYQGTITELKLSDIETNVTIDEQKLNVSSVAAGAFSGCETLRSVDLTKSVPSLSFEVGEGAFAFCPELGAVTLPEEVYTGYNVIGASAFEGDQSLEKVEIGSKFSEIREGAFKNCTALDGLDLPDTIATIASDTFSGCEDLTSVQLPAGLKSIGANAFADTSLSSLNLGGLEALRYIGEGAFANTALSSVTVPDSVTYIGQGAFVGLKNLTSVDIPFLGDRIDYQTPANVYGPQDLWFFANTYGIELEEDETRPITVTVRGTAQLPMGLFSEDPTHTVMALGGMKDITSITIGYAESGRYNVYGPDGVQFERVSVKVDRSIPERTFYGLENLTTLNVNGGVGKTVGDSAFQGCEKLTTLPDLSNVETIGDSAFQGCKELSTVPAMNKVKTIGSSAFRDTALTSFTVPSTVETIGTSVLAECPRLSSLTIERAEYRERNEDGNFEYKNIFSTSSSVTSGSVAGLFGTDEPDQDEDFPVYQLLSGRWVPVALHTVTVKGLSTVPNSMFSGWDNLYTATIGLVNLGKTDETHEIGSSAFSGCEMLSSLTIENDSLLQAIGSSAFKNCYELRSLTIPANVTSVSTGSSAILEGCVSLSSLTISRFDWVETSTNSNTKQYKTLFSGTLKDLFGSSKSASFFNDMDADDPLFGHVYSSGGTTTNSVSGNVTENNGVALPRLLSKVVVGSVTQLPHEMFSGFRFLTSIDLSFTTGLFVDKANRPGETPDKLPSLGSYAFSGCANLTTLNVTGGDNIKTLPTYVFSGCKSLPWDQVAKFGKVETIETYAFSGCEAFRAVTLPASVSLVRSNVFHGCSGMTSLTVSQYSHKLKIEAEDDDDDPTILWGTVDGTRYLLDPTERNGYRTDRDPGSSINNWFGAPSYSSSTGTVNPYDGSFPKSLTTITLNGVKDVKASTLNGIGDKPTSSTAKGALTTINVNFITNDADIEDHQVGNYAFEYCENVTAITFNTTDVKIGSNVFTGCKSLTKLPVTLTVSSGTSGVLSGCDALTELTLEMNGTASTSWYLGSLWGSSSSNNGVLPETLTKVTLVPSYRAVTTGASGQTTEKKELVKYWIPSNMFNGAKKITTVTFTASDVLGIGSNAFGTYNANEESNTLCGAIDTPAALTTLGGHGVYVINHWAVSFRASTADEAEAGVDVSKFAYVLGEDVVGLANSLESGHNVYHAGAFNKDFIVNGQALVTLRTSGEVDTKQNVNVYFFAETKPEDTANYGWGKYWHYVVDGDNKTIDTEYAPAE